MVAMASLLHPPLEQQPSGSSNAPSNAVSALDDTEHSVISQSRSSQTTVETRSLGLTSADQGPQPRHQPIQRRSERHLPVLRNGIVVLQDQ